MMLMKTLPLEHAAEEDLLTGSNEQQLLHHALRASGGDARTWHNRRLNIDCEGLILSTLVPPPSTAAAEMGATDYVQLAPKFGKRLCTERFVLSFAGAAARLPPHLRFLADLHWIQTMDHNISTLTPSYAAIDPRDGQAYSLYDHAIMDPTAEEVSSQSPVFSMGVWLLARDHTQPQQAKTKTHHHHNHPNPPNHSASPVTRTSSLHMQVLLCGHKHGGRRQDRAPLCPVCPWSCPCLVDEWYDEASESQLMHGTRLSHVCAKVRSLVVAAYKGGAVAAAKETTATHSWQTDPDALRRRMLNTNTTDMLVALDTPELFKAVDEAERTLCPLVPLTERLLQEPTLRQEFFSGSAVAWSALDETRFMLVEPSADGHTSFLRMCKLGPGRGGGARGEPPLLPGICSNAFALTSYVLNALCFRSGDATTPRGSAAATQQAQKNQEDSDPFVRMQQRIVSHACASLREVELKQHNERKAERAWQSYRVDVESFHNFLRIAFNDQLLRVLTHPYSETSEPCFHLPQGFVDDVLSKDSARRAAVVPMLQQRGRMPFPECLTDVQRERLAVAEERNWRFIRKGLRPPCLLLLNEAQLQHAPFTTVTTTRAAASSVRGTAASPLAAAVRLLPDEEEEALALLLRTQARGASSSSVLVLPVAAVVPTTASSSSSSSPSSVMSSASTTTHKAQDAEKEEELEKDMMRLLLDDNDHHHHMMESHWQPKKKRHCRTKTQRKAAQRARLQAEGEQNSLSLVEALRLSILELEESAVEDELARREAVWREAEACAKAAEDELHRAQALADAEAARLAEEQTLAEVERALETLLRAQQTLPALVRDGTAQLLRADQALWEPLLRQGLEHPDDDRRALDTACVMCLDTLDLAATSGLFPWTAPCAGNQLLCSGCFLALRDRHQQQQQRALPPPPCVCATPHPLAPRDWRLATEWVGRRWLAAHIGYNP
jgi:hypothetical protein